MQLVCPSCAAAYTIKPGALGTSGRTVRCAACATTWFAWPDPAATAAPAAPAPVVAPGPAPAPEILPPVPDAGAETAAAADRVGIEQAASRRRPARKSQRRADRAGGSPGLYVLAGLVLVLGATLFWRKEVVRQVPDLAGLYARVGLPVNVRGLDFREVVARVDFEAGQPVTVVEGEIVNLTGDALAVPRLRYSVRAVDGRELVSWAGPAPRPTIGPREHIPFRGRLTSPVQGGNDIEVRFLGARDSGRGVP